MYFCSTSQRAYIVQKLQDVHYFYSLSLNFYYAIFFTKQLNFFILALFGFLLHWIFSGFILYTGTLYQLMLFFVLFIFFLFFPIFILYTCTFYQLLLFLFCFSYFLTGGGWREDASRFTISSVQSPSKMLHELNFISSLYII